MVLALEEAGGCACWISCCTGLGWTCVEVVVVLEGGFGELVKNDGGCSAGGGLSVVVALLGDAIGRCPDDRVCCCFNVWSCCVVAVEL